MHRTGGPSVFKYEEVPLPKPRRGEMLIEVHAAGVNPVDTKIRQGKFPIFRADLPATLGRDVAGVVRSVAGKPRKGHRARFKVGDPVFGMLDYNRGGYAEYTVASPRELAHRPTKVSERDAAGIGVAALTAWQGLFDHGRLRRGQRVLIHGAAGGVGHFAVQFAKVKGATVIATASKRDLAWVKKIGADEVIDFENQRFEEHTNDIDLVLDLIGGDTLKRSWDVLKPKGGAIVSTLEEPSKVEARRHRARALRMMVVSKPPQLAQIAALIAAGRVKVEIAKVFPLKKAGAAHEFLEHAHARGKVMLETGARWTDLEARGVADAHSAVERLEVLAGGNLPVIAPFF